MTKLFLGFCRLTAVWFVNELLFIVTLLCLPRVIISQNQTDFHHRSVQVIYDKKCQQDLAFVCMNLDRFSREDFQINDTRFLVEHLLSSARKCDLIVQEFVCQLSAKSCPGNENCLIKCAENSTCQMKNNCIHTKMVCESVLSLIDFEWPEKLHCNDWGSNGSSIADCQAANETGSSSTSTISPDDESYKGYCRLSMGANIFADCTARSRKTLFHLPPSLPGNVTHVYMSGNRLHKLYFSALLYLKNLTYLDVSKNNLERLVSAKANNQSLSGLRFLKLSWNNLGRQKKNQN